MGARDVLAQLLALGVRLHRDGDALVAEPKSALTEDAREMIRANKRDLLKALRSRQDAAGRPDGQQAMLGSGQAPRRQEGALTRSQVACCNEAQAVDDLREHFEERAGILEHDGGLQRPTADLEAAKATAILARTRGYSWNALRSALPPEFSRGLPSGDSPVTGLPLGLPRWVVTTAGEPVQQGAFRVESVQ